MWTALPLCHFEERRDEESLAYLRRRYKNIPSDKAAVMDTTTSYMSISGGKMLLAMKYKSGIPMILNPE
jgi:hypothetical protein